MSASRVLLAGVLAAACSTGSGAPSSGASGEADAGAEGGDGGGPSLDTSLGGSITLPADATGRCVMIALDDDTTGSNGTARRSDGSYLAAFPLVTGRSVAFSFDRVPPGSYFLWAYVDVDSSASSPPGDCEIAGGPNTGDHLGYYDTGLSPPGTPNVGVPHATGLRYDFQLGVFP